VINRDKFSEAVLKSGTVLIIDDDEFAIKTIEMALDAAGNFKIVQAKDGEEGLEQYKANKPKLVILDLKMPVMDGHQFLAELEEIAPTPCKIFVCTGDLSSRIIDTPYSQKYCELLRKPFSIKELIAAVGSVI